MKLSLVERETILLYNQAEPMAEVYTHDPRLMEKLELLAKKHPDQITRKDAHNFTVPKQKLVLEEPIKAFGSYQVKAKLGFEVNGTVYVSVYEEK